VHKDFNIRKRALDVRKGALYTPKSPTENTLSVHSLRTVPSLDIRKRALYLRKEPIISTQQPHISAKEPYTCTEYSWRAFAVHCIESRKIVHK